MFEVISKRISSRYTRSVEEAQARKKALGVKFVLCSIFAGVVVRYFGYIPGTYTADWFPGILPADDDLRGELLTFLFFLWAAWISWYAKFINRVIDVIGPRYARAFHLTSSMETGKQVYDRFEKNGAQNIVYKTSVSRQVKYEDNGRFKSSLLSSKFTLFRNTGAMSHPEVQALVILYVLKAEGLISIIGADRLEFALVWGDGRGVISGGEFKVPSRMAAQIPLRTPLDLAQFEARHRGASSDAAVSELYGILTHAAQDDRAPDILKKMTYELFQKGDH